MGGNPQIPSIVLSRQQRAWQLPGLLLRRPRSHSVPLAPPADPPAESPAPHSDRAEEQSGIAPALSAPPPRAVPAESRPTPASTCRSCKPLVNRLPHVVLHLLQIGQLHRTLSPFGHSLPALAGQHHQVRRNRIRTRRSLQSPAHRRRSLRLLPVAPTRSSGAPATNTWGRPSPSIRAIPLDPGSVSCPCAFCCASAFSSAS